MSEEARLLQNEEVVSGMEILSISGVRTDDEPNSVRLRKRWLENQIRDFRFDPARQ